MRDLLTTMHGGLKPELKGEAKAIAKGASGLYFPLFKPRGTGQIHSLFTVLS